MPSPFPGMDPYLERHWGDVHHSFITYARDQLNKLLPSQLRALVEERAFVELPEERRRLVPDVRILEHTAKPKTVSGGSTMLASAKPLIIALDEPITEGYVEIRERTPAHRLVAVIEVLSPANKTPGEAQKQYLQKQQELWQGQVSLVEIDLLRAGHRLLPFSVDRLPNPNQTPYLVCVTRGWNLTQVEVYPISLRQPLPTIRIPLRQTDPDAPLNLQQLIEQCYENGSYTDDIDYRNEPDPPLPPAEARWANDLLRKQGKRSRNGGGKRGRRRNGKR